MSTESSELIQEKIKSLIEEIRGIVRNSNNDEACFVYALDLFPITTV